MTKQIVCLSLLAALISCGGSGSGTDETVEGSEQAVNSTIDSAVASIAAATYGSEYGVSESRSASANQEHAFNALNQSRVEAIAHRFGLSHERGPVSWPPWRQITRPWAKRVSSLKRSTTTLPWRPSGLRPPNLPKLMMPRRDLRPWSGPPSSMALGLKRPRNFYSKSLA